MMNSSILKVLAVLAVLCALRVEAAATIKLHVFDGSSKWWIAIDPRDELYETAKMEMRDSTTPVWTQMMANPSWGYFQQPSMSGNGFNLPLSFRLTDANGDQIVLNNAIAGFTSTLIDTNQQYGDSNSNTNNNNGNGNNNNNNNNGNGNTNPTTRPTSQPTTRPTTQPTTRPTTQPTAQPTTRPTTQPTTRPTTQPTTRPTSQPTTRPTTQPTTRPTTQPTAQPTTRPTAQPTTRPTQPTIAPQPIGDLCSIVPTSTEPLKILVPLYVYPGSQWDQVVTAAKTGVKIIAIINPNSGPDSSGPDSSYVSYMKKLKDAGVEMIGYVHTSWGARAISDVQNEISIYATKYAGVTGIFFDEASAESKDVAYYRTAYNAVISKSGFVHSILNPGVQPDQQYMAISSNIVIFEDSASYFSAKKYSTWVNCAPNAAQKAGYKYKFSMIAHTASLANMPALVAQTQAKGIGLVYVTDGAGGCCTYNSLTSYLSQEASAVKAL